MLHFRRCPAIDAAIAFFFSFHYAAITLFASLVLRLQMPPRWDSHWFIMSAIAALHASAIRRAITLR